MAKRAFFIAYSLSIFGTGLVYPLTAIFLRESIQLSASEVGFYFAVLAISGLVVNPLAGMWCDRQGPYRVAATAVVGQAIGPVLLGLSNSPSAVTAAALFTGVGSGIFFAVQTPLVANLFGKEAIGEVYARQYVIMNIATAFAGFLSGWSVGQWGDTAFRIAFLGNGLSFLLYGIIVLGFVGSRLKYPLLVASEGDARRKSKSRPWHPYVDRKFIPLLLMQLIISAFGFAQMDGVLPVIIREVGGMPVIVVSVFLTCNCLAVVVMQSKVTKISKRIGDVASMRLVFAIWCSSFVIGSLSMVLTLPLAARVILIIFFAIVFAVGECFLSPSFNPLIAATSPTDSLGSYSAAASMMYGFGLALGPAVMLPVFKNSVLYWGGLLAAMVIGLALLKTRSEPKQSTDQAGVTSGSVQ
ncbi:MFS transporter [Streptomyces parvus]|uniref:MFS transporter n=1 Tax=Streptomyces parvus TaxID=66428 RepID=A0A7K3RWL4_9ACTN|nr:MFS transporter [Streptomyces parvus]NEC19611.1 MFS transporter [Streptomyces parvus]